MCDRGNAAKRARTYEEYRGCLIEAVPGVQSESTDVLLRTGYGPGFILRRILKSFANYVTRIVVEAGATMTTTRTRRVTRVAIRLISHPSRADSIIRPLLLASVNLFAGVGHVKWRNCASGTTLWCASRDRLDWPSVREFYWGFVRREGPKIERPSESSLDGIGNAARHPEGCYRELSTGAIVTF